MAGTNHHQELKVEKFQTPTHLKTIIAVLGAIGVLTFAISWMKSPERLWPAYLTAFFFFTTLGLGGLFFTALQHATKAGWSVTIRRYSEAMTSFIPFIFIGGLVLLAGMKYLFPWANPHTVAESAVLEAKTGYLNVGFFVIRLVIFCGGWFLFKWFIVGNSLKQDQTGDEKLTLKNVGLSVGFILSPSMRDRAAAAPHQG